MDERRLSELLADAAAEAEQTAPPATFSHADVVASAQRARARTRRWQTGAVGLAVVVVAGAGLASVQLLADPVNHASTLAQPAPPPPAVEQRQAAPGASAHSGQPYAATPFDAKRGGPAGCAQPDRALFEQLTEALPAVRGATPRPLSREVSCPAGGRGFEVDVAQGRARGVLRVLLSPHGGGMSVRGSGGGSLLTTSASAAGGGSLSMSIAAPGRAPYANQLHRLADTLAERN